MINNIKKHVWIALILYIPLMIIRYFAVKWTVPYGQGLVSVGTFLSLFYGIYLFFISCAYFKQISILWAEGKPWKKELLKSYALLVVWFLLIGVAMTGLMALGALETRSIFNSLMRIFSPYTAIVGASIVFPISLYTLYLSIKSLILAKKEGKSKDFGGYLLTISIILSLVSLWSFFVIMVFLLFGGINP